MFIITILIINYNIVIINISSIIIKIVTPPTFQTVVRITVSYSMIFTLLITNT
ncbi:hypothetical protein DPMN_173153 [Dreissena polymorpha]|uniref:Uncharacterized protein n=1 Tax=Dreissena polymorpha TaxID=45954 RepID=A0A9D4E447_DREPO|nr:hypothetical protein DPMN_173153 [Dreissena polymorpha]